MSNSIEVIEDIAIATEVILQPSKVEGYMAWTAGQFPPYYWSQAYAGVEQPGERDPYKCPYPLFPTREKALEACTKALPQGGTCKLVKIVL
jgi:hypothetical protein